MPERKIESLAKNITLHRLVTLNCWSLSSELQQTALSKLLLYLHTISPHYLCTVYCIARNTHQRSLHHQYRQLYHPLDDADERKVGGCAIAVRNDYNDSVDELRYERRQDAPLYDCGIAEDFEMWIVSAHAATETTEYYNKDVFYEKFSTLISKIQSQKEVIAGIDLNAKMVLEQQFDVLGK
ncbi:hypothetical protein RB195_018558 [Necator americanus]